jgi:hypothetical protein
MSMLHLKVTGNRKHRTLNADIFQYCRPHRVYKAPQVIPFTFDLSTYPDSMVFVKQKNRKSWVFVKRLIMFAMSRHE